MTSTIAVVIAGVLQLLRTSFFIEQRGDLCSPAPVISSWIFLIAYLDILSDVGIYPMRYMHLPYFCQLIVETVVAILLTEFGTIVIWCTLEKLCCRLTKSALLVWGMPQYMYTKWESYILGMVTMAISCVILVYAEQATDHFHMIRMKCKRIQRKVTLNVGNFWKYVNSRELASRAECSQYAGSRDDEDGLMCSKRRRRRQC